MLPNDVPSPPCSPSRLVHAMENQEGIVAKQCWDDICANNNDHLLHSQPPLPITATNLVSASRSTPRQLHRQRSFAGLRPFPTRTPSMTLIRHRSTSCLKKSASNVHLLPRLEKENANLPPQDSISFILAQIEKQNVILDEDPKSVCIQSNELKAHLSTMQHLVNDSSEDNIDWEFWTALTDDFGAVATKLPHLLSAKLKAGIPDKLRGVIWQAMSQASSLHLETVYGQLVAEHTPYERVIQRDLARTFPTIDMFKQEGGDGQQALERVLKAYSLYDAHVGYCQGLAFLVGPLLMNMPEQQAFCVFVRLMETYEMRTMFTLNMEGLQLRLYQFSSLLSQMLPELSDHLAYHGVHPPMYASQWFLTLFAYAFPIPLVLRIYDIVFAEGAAETIMRVAIAILQRSEHVIMQLTEFEDILDHVTTKLHQGNDASQMINDAMQLSGQITREKMDHLAQEYMRELENDKKQADQVLAIRFNFWSRSSGKKKNNAIKQRTSSTSSGSSTSSNCTSPITPQPAQQVDQQEHLVSPASTVHEDTAALHQQIEELLLSLSQTQTEHLQVKQELVQVRMDKMDIEAERDLLRMTVMDMEGDPRVELAKLKAAHFELQQQNEELLHEKQMTKEAQNQLVEKIVDMEIRMNDMKQEHEEKTHEYERRLEQSISDERCRELERLLAEAKLQIAELETFGPTATRHTKSTHSHSKRRSLDPVALAQHRTMATTTTATGGNKRSSFYGRLWSSVTTSSNTPSQDTPPTSPI